MKRKLLGLWNAYIFLNTYACLDNPDLTNYTPDERTLTFMDRWLINRVNEFTKNAHTSYSKQEFGGVSKDFEVLVDELTNWYIRNNRRRFYKSENNMDTLNAYFCLHYAIKNISMAMFPIIPFITEYLWQNAVRPLDKNASESVALHGYVMNEFKVKDEHLTKSTDIVREIFTMASKLRNENQIKVKQPLKTMFVNGNEEVAKAVELYRDIIESELNIKNVVMEQDNSKFNIEFLNLDFRKAGAVLKGDVQKVKNYLVNATDDEMKNYVDGFKSGNVNIKEFENLPSELFTLATKAKDEFVISNENEITVVLDVTLDRDLMLEGLARELIRSAQVMRKEADFNVDDRIEIEFETTSEELNEILNKFEEKIKTELLVKNISKISSPEIQEEVEIGDDKLIIKMKR